MAVDLAPRSRSGFEQVLPMLVEPADD